MAPPAGRRSPVPFVATLVRRCRPGNAEASRSRANPPGPCPQTKVPLRDSRFPRTHEAHPPDPDPARPCAPHESLVIHAAQVRLQAVTELRADIPLRRISTAYLR